MLLFTCTCNGNYTWLPSGSIKILRDITLLIAITRQCPAGYVALLQEVVKGQNLFSQIFLIYTTEIFYNFNTTAKKHEHIFTFSLIECRLGKKLKLILLFEHDQIT